MANSRLFLFCIGGTGARVMKSLTMLLIAGVKINADSIVPVFIDPDKENGDLKRSIRLLENYHKLFAELNTNSNTNLPGSFFSTKIEEPVNVMESISEIKFSDYLVKDNMTNDLLPTKALVEQLFTESNLNTELNVGFKGFPNIGSVVLNSLFKKPEITKILNSIKTTENDDKVFIISSVFGGTGAAGFPLLVKNIRQYKENDNLSNAIIGALAMQPYFNITEGDKNGDKKSTINSKIFVQKSKVAMEYYWKNLLSNKSLNIFYTISGNNTLRGNYENHVGASLQKNDAFY